MRRIGRRRPAGFRRLVSLAEADIADEAIVGVGARAENDGALRADKGLDGTSYR
jgi:hypothetical protein